MPVIDMKNTPVKTGSIYPAPYNAEMAGRSSLRLGDVGGLTQFGANLVILEPNAKSSLRHWHLNEDEFVMVTMGTCTLIDDTGETQMDVGDCAAFPAGDANGHHFINKSTSEARFLVVGSRKNPETATYTDVDMMVVLQDGAAAFSKRDGSPLPIHPDGENT
ncbi:MAG: cupin domain-containing protein [Rhodobacterales bacterium]|nr:cupin domain-containing protein [Rhodobacterales bacterium]